MKKTCFCSHLYFDFSQKIFSPNPHYPAPIKFSIFQRLRNLFSPRVSVCQAVDRLCWFVVKGTKGKWGWSCMLVVFSDVGQNSGQPVLGRGVPETPSAGGVGGGLRAEAKIEAVRGHVICMFSPFCGLSLYSECAPFVLCCEQGVNVTEPLCLCDCSQLQSPSAIFKSHLHTSTSCRGDIP